MSREIKFRGFSISKKEWVYGYLWIVPGVDLHYLLTGKIDVRDCSIEKYEVYPESVGEYTGLKDKHGKKIYEGDIIEGGYLNPLTNKFLSRKYLVEYEKGCFEGRLTRSPNCGGTWLHFIKGDVIGNIYENPELSEDK